MAETDIPPTASLPDLPADTVLLREGRVAFAPSQRDLEKAPLLLRYAAWALLAGSLLPWYGHHGTWITLGAAKAVVLLGCFLFYAGVLATRGEAVPAGLGGLGKQNWGPPPGARPKNVLQSIGKIAPTPLHVLAWAVTAVGLVLPVFDPGLPPVEGGPSFSAAKAIAEVMMALLAAGTLVHIFAYEKGGHFNPLFPLLFVGAAIAGLVQLVAQFGAEQMDMLAVLGAGISTGAGVFATYVIALALMEAKKEGDRKKAEALEARKSARAARRSASSK